MKLKAKTSLFAGAVALVSPAYPAAYVQVFDEAELNNALSSPLGAPFYDTSAVSGSTVYSISRDIPAETAAIVAFDTNSSSFSTVMSPSQWSAVSVEAPIVTYGFTPISGNRLRFISTNFSDRSLYDVDIVTGNVTKVNDAPSGVSSNAVFRNDGSGFVYDPGGDILYSISAAGDFSQFSTGFDAQGSLEISGDTLYFFTGAGSTEDLLALDLNTSTASTVLTAAQIDAATEDVDGTVGFFDIFAGPDGLLYFYETDSDAILSFDPSDPLNTLNTVLSETELSDGPADDTLTTLAWLDGELAFVNPGDGFYQVPEPSAFAALSGLLALAAAITRRSRLGSPA